MELAKIQVKMLKGDAVSWDHFCYVPYDLKARFDRRVNTRNLISNYWIALWAYNEFGLKSIDTPEAMNALKEAVKNKYRERYPELYMETATDRQGWLRVWFVENMESELKSVGE